MILCGQQTADDNMEWWRVECAAGIWIEGRIGTGGGGDCGRGGARTMTVSAVTVLFVADPLEAEILMPSLLV